MNTSEIRKSCYDCGHRCLMLVEGAQMATDYCDKAQMECAKIVLCHPSARIPKTGRVQKKRAVQGGM